MVGDYPGGRCLCLHADTLLLLEGQRVLNRIIPPNSPERVTQWRWFVFIALSIALINGAAGRGLFPLFDAYASESALSAQTDKIDKLLKMNIAATLRELRKEECSSNGNLRTIQNTIEEYQQQYIDLTNQRYPLPKCDE